MDIVKRKIIEICKYLQDLIRSPQEALNSEDRRDISFYLEVVVLCGFISLILEILFSTFDFSNIKASLIYTVIFVISTVISHFIFLKIIETQFFKTISKDNKNFLQDFFFRLVIIISLLSLVIGVFLRIGITFGNYKSIQFVVVLVVSYIILNKKLKHKILELSLILALILHFNVVVSAYLSTLSLFSYSVFNGDSDQDFENQISSRVYLLTKDEVLQEWLINLAETTKDGLDSPETFAKDIKSNVSKYNKIIYCINTLAKGNSAELIEKVNSIVITSEEMLNRYLKLQELLSGDFYTIGDDILNFQERCYKKP